MSIKVQQLLKQYGEQLAVNEISFEARKGEITGFLGPNGAGKSTTMKMLTGYLQPDGGQALVCDTDVVKQPMQVKKKIGYLPESNALYHDMYIKEYLEFTGQLYGVKNLKQRVTEVIDQAGLTPEAHKKIGQLSKGYKQRVGLAAAIIHNPEVLILDEPTSGLDPNQIVEIRKVIKELSANKTVLLSTHIMQEVEAICDHVVIISKGRIVANDALATIRNQSSSPVLKVRFAETLEAEWLTRLTAVQSAEKDGADWILKGNGIDAMRKQVLELVQSQHLNLLSLAEAGSSLEQIFRQLTTDENH